MPVSEERRRRATAAVVAAVRARGGITPLRALHDDGHSRYTVDRARNEGALIRARKGWMALPDADPLLMLAAGHNVALTCVTQAERLGLFVLAGSATVHVTANPHSGRAPANARVHWRRPVVPKHPDALVDPLENVLVTVATCVPFEQALVVWESALQKRLVDPHSLARYRLPPSARRLLAEADAYSDSGLETLVVPRLRRFGLRLRRQIWISGHHVDLLIGDRLILQIDGAHHVGLQRTSDIAHDAQLMLMGYHVIRVGYHQVVDQWADVQDLIMRAIAQGLHDPH